MDEQEFGAARRTKMAEAMGQAPPPEEPADPALIEAPAEEAEQPEPTVEEPRTTIAPPPDPVEEPPPLEQPTVEDAVAEAVDALPEGATAEEQQAAEEAAVEDFFVGRFKTKEEAERGLEERDRYLEQLERERVELRKELQQAKEAQQAQPEQQLDVGAWQEWATNAVEEGQGQQAAVAALREGGFEAYEIVAAEWVASEDPDDRRSALRFNNWVQRERAAAMQEVAAQQAAQPQQQADAAVEIERSARLQIEERRPDFGRYEREMGEVLDSLPPTEQEWLKGLAQSGVDGAVRAADYIYLEAKARMAPRRAHAQQVADDRVRSSAEAAKVAASGLPTEATPPRTPARTPAEEAVIGRKNRLRAASGLPLIE